MSGILVFALHYEGAYNKNSLGGVSEAARLASGKPARRFARQMKKVQSVVGDHQDTVIARQAARDLGIGAHLAGENAFTYGLLHEREHDQAERLQVRARTVWKKASRPRHRTWMR